MNVARRSNHVYHWVAVALLAGVCAVPSLTFGQYGGSGSAPRRERRESDRPRRTTPSRDTSRRQATPPPPRPVPVQPPANVDNPTPPGPYTPPEETAYPFRVYMKDGREIDCDVKEAGGQYELVKKAGTLTVAKADVDRIEPLSTPTSQPTSQPATQPASPSAPAPAAAGAAAPAL